jgi:hypothetical protein
MDMMIFTGVEPISFERAMAYLTSAAGAGQVKQIIRGVPFSGRSILRPMHWTGDPDQKTGNHYC